MPALALALIALAVIVLAHQRAHRKRTEQREAALDAVESSTPRQIAAWSAEEREHVAELLSELRVAVTARHMVIASDHESREQMYADLKRVTAAEKRLSRSVNKNSRLASV